MTILGKVPAQPGDRINPKDAERILAGALLQELRDLNQTTTARQARLQSQVVNGVLEAGTQVLDSSGQFTRSYHAAIGALVVTNATGALLTVVSTAGAGPTAPTAGNGVHLVPSGLVMTIPIDNRGFTLYGLAGQPISFQAWTGLQPFGVVQ